MAVNTIPLGREERLFAKAESTFGAFAMPAATDAFAHRSAAFTLKRARDIRDDKRQSRSALTRISGKKSGDWRIGGYLVPSGAAGTAPDMDVLLKAVFGSSSNSPGVSQTYSLASGVTLHDSLSMYQQLSHMARGFKGCIVNQAQFKVSGTGKAEVEFSGEYADEFYAGSCVTSGALVNLATSVTLAAGEGKKFAVGGRISIGTSAGPHEITGISADTLTITPGVAGAQADAAAVTPYLLTPTIAGSPVPGCIGSFTIGGVTVYIVDGTVTLNNNMKLRTDEYGRTIAAGYSLGDRAVTFDLNLYLDKDYLRYYGDALQYVSKALVLTIGSTAGSICTINLPYAEFNIPPIDAGGNDEVKWKISGAALGSSGDDEISVVFT
ncbi:MAG TPA: phage tail tube protein [Thermodesulfobacteriota bacterium]|nr:phage tail tube protein [Thermodesulfobacteriota bacterium]